MHEERFRNKVTWMMFLLSILVIWVHSYNVDLFAGGFEGPLRDGAAKIENMVSVGLGQIAVPGFFLLSSYLFFRNYRPDLLVKKWKGRFQSIVIPYVIWNSMYYLGYAAATRLPFVQSVVGKDAVPFRLDEYLKAVLQYSHAPIFWYLYQLIILILLSPVIYFLVKGKITGLVYLAALFAAIHFGLDMQHPNTDALTYYSAAAWMALHGKEWVEAAWNRRRAYVGVGIMVFAGFCFYRMGRGGADVLWTVFFRLLAPAALWLLIRDSALGAAKPWMKQSLYLYAVHYVIVRFMNKGAAMALRPVLKGEAMMGAALVIYFLQPVAVVWLSYGSALILSRYLPPVWKVLSGGRRLDG